MNDFTSIKKIYMNCPVCGKKHEVEERERNASIKIKGEEIFYKEKFYFCPDAGEDRHEFVTGSMANEDLLNARDTYRTRKGLLTSNEIADISKKYGLSSAELSDLLGWDEKAVSRYESKVIQGRANDYALRFVKANPRNALFLLNKNADRFTPERTAEIKSNLKLMLQA